MTELRQIRTLRLGASRREHVQRAAIMLEDALRTASMPHLPCGALLLVRRLDLGRLPTDASPQWLSRHIETCLQALPPTPARARDGDRAGAPAVWFADRSEALAALLATSVTEMPRAWYWAGVLPGWRPGLTLRALLPLTLRAAEAEGQVGVAALLDRLLSLDRLDPVLRHLEPSDIVPLASSTSALASPFQAPSAAKEQAPVDAPQARAPSETSAAAAASSPSSATDVPASRLASDTWHAVLAAWLRQWGPDDPRSRWLAGHALIAVHGPAAAEGADQLIAQLTPPPKASADQIELAADRLRQPDQGVAGEPERNPPPQHSAVDASHVQPLHQQPQPSGREVGDPRHAGPDARGSAAIPASPEALRAADTDAWPPAEPDWQPSRHAGLLLLLPAIARLGIADADADGDLCLCLLHRIADRLRIRKDDAIRCALPKPLPRAEPRHFVPPPTWNGLRLPRRADLGGEDRVLTACQLVLARFLRRYARTSLRRLVRRPALVHATRTHIDLRFDARWVELDLRLAGLDLDPGWVPWLGRVVTFYYDYESQA